MIEPDLFGGLAASLKPAPDLDEKIAESREIIEAMLAKHNPVAVFGAFSGGHDSACATHLISQHPRFVGAVAVNTTMGIPETAEYRRKVAGLYQWTYTELFPPTSYREIVLEHGFPGPASHPHMYRRLKERALRPFVQAQKTSWFSRVAFISGARLGESERRFGTVTPMSRAGALVWCSPILNWTDADKNAYMARFDIPRNPVVDQLCMSGECLCGAFAAPGEIAIIEHAFPKTGAEIRALEVEAKAKGVHCHWGTRPPGRQPKPDPRQLAMCLSCVDRRPA
jgi:3'-phosphoadenosine 5'-phosphosulfate sulfotransferase (PAPS reductase)/FAD synthetase